MIRKFWFRGVLCGSLLTAIAGCTHPLTESLLGLTEAVGELRDEVAHQPPPGDVIVNVTATGGAGGGGSGIGSPPASQPAGAVHQARPVLPQNLIAWIDEGATGTDWTLTLGIWDGAFTEGFNAPAGWTASLTYTLLLFSNDGMGVEVEVAAGAAIAVPFTLDPVQYDPSSGCISAVLELSWDDSAQTETYSLTGGCR